MELQAPYPPTTSGPAYRLWRASGRAVSATRNDPRAAVGVTLLFLYILIALVGASFSPYDTTTPNIKVRMQGPSWEHPFGTDRIGRDVATRIIAGSRVSLHVAAGAVIVALLLGAPLGALSSYVGGAFDALVQRVIGGHHGLPVAGAGLGVGGAGRAQRPDAVVRHRLQLHPALRPHRP